MFTDSEESSQGGDDERSEGNGESVGKASADKPTTRPCETMPATPEDVVEAAKPAVLSAVEILDSTPPLVSLVVPAPSADVATVSRPNRSKASQRNDDDDAEREHRRLQKAALASIRAWKRGQCEERGELRRRGVGNCFPQLRYRPTNEKRSTAKRSPLRSVHRRYRRACESPTPASRPRTRNGERRLSSLTYDVW